MAYGGGAAATAAQAAAIARAIKASGAIVQVEPDEFRTILSRAGKALVVMAQAGVWHKSYQYLVSYKGLIFYTKSATELMMPGDIELIYAKQIWIP